MTMQVDKARLDEMLLGLEGVTPGPRHLYVSRRDILVTDDAGNNMAHFLPMDDDPSADFLNATSFARCDPDTIRSIITELLELRSLRSTEGKEGEIEQLTRERDEAWGARNENAKLKGQRDAALASAKAARENFLTMQGSSAQLLGRAEAAEAHVAKLREALEPFARATDVINISYRVTEKHLEAARAALTRSTE